MKWSPRRRNLIAVGTRNGVCLWTLTRGQVPPCAPELTSCQSDYANVELHEPTRAAGGQPQCSLKSLDMPAKPVVSSDSSMAEVSAWVNLLESPVGACWGAVHSVAFSPEGALLAMSSATDPNLVLWDLGSESPTVLRALACGNTLLEWSPSGNFLVAGTT